MIDLNDLKSKCASCLTEMEATFDKMQAVKDDKELSGEEVTSKVTTLEAIYDDLKVKADAIKMDMVRAEQIAEIRRDAEKLRGMTEPKPTEVQTGDERGKIDAQARDTVKEERLRVGYFCDWLVKKSVPDKYMQEMQPTSPKLMELASPGMTMVMPRSMARKVVGGYWGKADDGIMLSTDIFGGDKLFDDEFRPRLLELPPEPGIVYPKTTKVPTVTGTVKWPRLIQTDADERGSVAVTWVAEGATKGLTEPAFEQLTIATNELSAQTQVSRTLLGRSAIDLEAFVPRMFRDAIVNELDNVVLNGNGIGKPLGVVQDADVRAVPRATVNDIDFADVVDMKYKIRAQHRGALLWVIADDAAAALTKKKDADGRPFYVPNPLSGQFETLLGIPAVTTHLMSFKAAGDVILGDWSQYISAVEQEVLVQRSDHRHMEKGLILFVVTVLVGGRAALPRAFAYLKATTS